MQFKNVNLEKSERQSDRKQVVAGDMLLGEVIGVCNLQENTYLFVEDTCGQLIGVVETSRIQELLAAVNPIERERWHQMTVESVLRWKLTQKVTPEKVSPQNGPSDGVPVTNIDSLDELTLVQDDHGLLAISSKDDLFVNWNLVKSSLVEASFDAVTGLPNRRGFTRRLEEEFHRARRQGHSVGVILFDVDHFKSVNDMYGHGVGDEVLNAIADTMLKLLRSYDLLVRYGGDEFAAICCACAPGEIDIPLRRIQQHFKRNFEKFAVELPPISLTIGAAIAHDVSLFQTSSDLVELADIALYRGKEAGRDCSWKVEVASRTDLTSDPVEVHAEVAMPRVELPVDLSLQTQHELS